MNAADGNRNRNPRPCKARRCIDCQQPVIAMPSVQSRNAITIWTFAAAFAAAAAFALTSRYPGYVHHDTAEIAMWSRLGWIAGLPKHPPLLPWLFRAYGMVVPLDWVTLSLLTVANIVLGAWAVWRIAGLFLGHERAAIALMLYGLAPAGTFFAMKLNHNGILVSLWPLTMLAFLLCLRANTPGGSALYGVVFGMLAAASMLAKYYSGVLLVTCFAAALFSANRARFFALPGGYIAVGVFAALMAPHALWNFNHHAATLAFALKEAEHETYSLARFLLITPTYLLPAAAGFLALNRWLERRQQVEPSLRVQPELWVLAVAPFAITAALIGAFNLRGSSSWSLPDFCVVPVILAGLLPAPSTERLAQLKRVAARILIAVAVAGPLTGLIAFATGDPNAVEPRAELARASGAIFAAATGRETAIVTGDPQSANAAALDIAARPIVYSSFDPAAAPWISRDDMARDGVLVICRVKVNGCREQAAALSAGRSALRCELTRSRRLLFLTGPLLVVEVTVIAPDGVRISQAAAATACASGGMKGRVLGLTAP